MAWQFGLLCDRADAALPGPFLVADRNELASKTLDAPQSAMRGERLMACDPGNFASDPPRGRQIPGAPGCEFLVGAFSDHAFPRHSHEGLMLSVIDGGSQRVECRGGVLVAGPGQIIAVGPQEVHRSGAGDAGWWRYHSLMVPPAVASELGAHRIAINARGVFDDRELAAAVRGITEPMLAGEVLTAQEVVNRVLVLFLARHGHTSPMMEPGTGREARAVALTQAYLRARLDRIVSLADLEGVTGVDRSRLTRAFTRAVGMPPHAWHMQVRLREGQDRLAKGDDVAGTAALTGFADQAHFTRAFRRLCGITPAAFRAEHRRPR